MGKIDSLHSAIYTLVNGITTFNQGFYEKPKEITDEKLPAFAVYYLGHENEVSTSYTNKRRYEYAIDIIYDKETISTSQTVTSDLVSEVINKLEDTDNFKLSNNASYTEPTRATRIEDYQIAGKHYLAYQVILPVITNETL